MHNPTRRDFLKVASAIAAGGALSLSDAIERAAAIGPPPGSTYLDAEHVVILMQENRSFDHAFGRLRGVRGFDDPRAIRLANGNPVWVQTSGAGESYLPFRLDLQGAKSTWMGCLPHGWPDQVDARNGGLYDRWLDAKASGQAAFRDMPLTLGYYDRRDIPFYYELADAFTICDQHFCSSLTGTTPNRSYLWSGTIRAEQRPDSPPHLENRDIDYGAEVSWTTFPERLEDLGISWKVYQNEMYLDVGLSDEEDAWLGNFGDNPLEYFSQYRSRFAPTHRRQLEARAERLSEEVAALHQQQGDRELSGPIAAVVAAKRAELAAAEAQRDKWSEAEFRRLSPRDRRLHRKAFCTNSGDPTYRRLETLTYSVDGQPRELAVPAGDVLHQFRQDVRSGQLPAVSWLVAPERFSDHPDSPWYGAWYIAEAFRILTENPEVWRKTIFILTYDENDGYFDHVPPFAAPDPRRPETGRVSRNIDADVEYVYADDELSRKPPARVRENSIGLGYRVPMVIASPWSRGGYVCSQVFDHTSSLQLLEHWLTQKAGQPVREPNISQWRRTVCGNLSAAFRPASDEPMADIAIPRRDDHVRLIYETQFQPLPSPGSPLTAAELEALRADPNSSNRMPRQEPGQRRSTALPYELAADGRLSDDRDAIVLTLEARSRLFGEKAAGSPFTAYARTGPAALQVRNYAVSAGDALDDSWPLSAFDNGQYEVDVHGPNGFYRGFFGSADDPRVSVTLLENSADLPAGQSRRADGTLAVHVSNAAPHQAYTVLISDMAYGAPPIRTTVQPGSESRIAVDISKSSRWYDLNVRIEGHPSYERRYAGRVESGRPGYSDPAIGRAT